MINTAKVIAVNGKTATVEAERKSACEGCHKNNDGGCTVCSLLGGNRKISAVALNNAGAKTGDTVEIESSDRRMVLYAILIFLIPVVAALTAYFIALPISGNVTVAIISAAVSFVLSFVIIALYSKLTASKRYDVIIVKIIQ